MLDPITLSPWLRDATQPLANVLHLQTLPLHIHEVLLGLFVYTTIDVVVSPYLSKRLLPKAYSDFPNRTRLQWNMHVTAFVNSAFLAAAASYVLYADQDRLNKTWEERMWGYTGAGGMVQAFGAGYFLWDLQVSARNMDHLGVIDLLHAVVGLAIAMLGFVRTLDAFLLEAHTLLPGTILLTMKKRPFGLYYGIQYALLEVSTPFANMHWFLNKLNRSGTRLYVINGMLLMFTFAACRLIWGSYLTFVFFRDVWVALHASEHFKTAYYYSATQKPLVIDHKAAWWVAVMIMAANAVVMSLSFFWFSKMVAVVRKSLKTSRGEFKDKAT